MNSGFVPGWNPLPTRATAPFRPPAAGGDPPARRPSAGPAAHRPGTVGGIRAYLDGAADGSFEKSSSGHGDRVCGNGHGGERQHRTAAFVPKISNWSVCDSFLRGAQGRAGRSGFLVDVSSSLRHRPAGIRRPVRGGDAAAVLYRRSAPGRCALPARQDGLPWDGRQDRRILGGGGVLYPFPRTDGGVSVGRDTGSPRPARRPAKNRGIPPGGRRYQDPYPGLARVLITGPAGFPGTCTAHYPLLAGHPP